MNIIVAADNNWGIGLKNELLIRIPNDHKHFREETVGKVVVTGRKTLATFPQGQPLMQRKNIIPLIGNHELMMYTHYCRPELADYWFHPNNGGMQTQSAFDVLPPSKQQKILAYIEGMYAQVLVEAGGKHFLLQSEI